MALNLMRLAVLAATVLAVAACAAPGSRAADSSPGTAAYAPPAPSTGEAAAESVPFGLDVGQRAPAFSVTGLDGREVSDVDLRAQGKPYILYFYATW